jgi:hypothetical protein
LGLNHKRHYRDPVQQHCAHLSIQIYRHIINNFIDHFVYQHRTYLSIEIREATSMICWCNLSALCSPEHRDMSIYGNFKDLYVQRYHTHLSIEIWKAASVICLFRKSALCSPEAGIFWYIIMNNRSFWWYWTSRYLDQHF